MPFLVEGPDGSRWTIAADGTVRASGAGALITPNRGDCDVPDAETWYGTDAAGLPLDLVAPQWWGDQAVAESDHETDHESGRHGAGLPSASVADSTAQTFAPPQTERVTLIFSISGE